MIKKIPLILLIFTCNLPAIAQEAPDLRQDLVKSTRQLVIEVTDGDTVTLKDQSRVRLVGLQAPKLPLGRKHFTPWPLAREAKKKLEELILDQYVTLYYGGASTDRYGRALAHLFRDDGLWVQGEMLKHGLARLYSFADNRALVPAMRDREQEARQLNRGIWALDYYQPKDQAGGLKHRNQFQLVTGVVRDVAQIRGTSYLNFGENWREDFTIVIKAPARRLFQKAGLDPAAFQGKEIEVRGWLKSYNGPMIEATHPEQIVIIKERDTHDPVSEK